MIYDHPRKKHLYSLPNIIKKLILDDWEKDHTRLDWCLILSENLDKKFNAVGIKNPWQNKKLLCDKFVKKKKKVLQNISRYAKFFRITMFTW